MSLGLSATDMVGMSDSMKQQSENIFGFSVFIIDSNKNVEFLVLFLKTQLLFCFVLFLKRETKVL